jgi:predicted Zn-dependent protease
VAWAAETHRETSGSNGLSNRAWLPHTAVVPDSPKQPMFLARDDVKAIADRLLSLSRADSCSVFVDGSETQSLRFASGSATTNVASSQAKLRVTSNIGGRSGSVAVGGLDAQAMERALARSEEIARLMPEDPEFMSPLGPQNYLSGARYDEATAALGLGDLAEAAARVIAEVGARGVNSFGYAGSGRRFEAMATSNGLFAYDRTSFIDLSTTARHASDRWSGWAGGCSFAAAGLDAAAIGRRAAEKAAQEAEAIDLEPGRYTVILEPVAVGELARWLMWMMEARAADEGRSFFSGRGAARIGEKLFDETITLRSSPQDAVAPESCFGAEGLVQRPRIWIEKGMLRDLARSRFWARKTNAEPVPAARSFTLEGGATSLEEMIAATRRGVLVTRFWYTNMLDPRSLLLTGLTRDGNFLIENGRIVAPLRNMRFNESLARVFSRVSAIGPSARVWLDMGGDAAVSAPPMMVEEFEFSSRSSGI